MKTYSITTRGMVRSENQDCCFTSELPVGCLPNLFIVADGMGGHVGGKYASHKALQAVINSLQSKEEEFADEGRAQQVIEEAIQRANEEVIEESQKQGMEGMGTTLVVATILQGNRLLVANVGDSRLYIVSPSGIRQVTQDHSLVEEMVRMGELDPSNARTHEKKNVITRAIGANLDLNVDYFVEELEPEECIIMCSDGLSNMIDDEEIRMIFQSGRDVIEKAEKLVDTANTNGGKDNITVVVIEP